MNFFEFCEQNKLSVGKSESLFRYQEEVIGYHRSENNNDSDAFFDEFPYCCAFLVLTNLSPLSSKHIKGEWERIFRQKRDENIAGVFATTVKSQKSAEETLPKIGFTKVYETRNPRHGSIVSVWYLDLVNLSLEEIAKRF